MIDDVAIPGLTRNPAVRSRYASRVAAGASYDFAAQDGNRCEHWNARAIRQNKIRIEIPDFAVYSRGPVTVLNSIANLLAMDYVRRGEPRHACSRPCKIATRRDFRAARRYLVGETQRYGGERRGQNGRAVCAYAHGPSFPHNRQRRFAATDSRTTQFVVHKMRLPLEGPLSTSISAPLVATETSLTWDSRTAAH